jgi:hypothetical protein
VFIIRRIADCQGDNRDPAEFFQQVLALAVLIPRQKAAVDPPRAGWAHSGNLGDLLFFCFAELANCMGFPVLLSVKLDFGGHVVLLRRTLGHISFGRWNTFVW